MFLIVGLGNPGKEYDGTRHNIGFEVVDYISDKYNIEINRVKFKGVCGEGCTLPEVHCTVISERLALQSAALMIPVSFGIFSLKFPLPFWSVILSLPAAAAGLF